MAFLNRDEAATVGVKVAGVELRASVYADLLSVSVQDEVDAASMFVLKLLTWDPDALAISWADGDLFKLGAEVEIQMGYVNALRTVMFGEITGLELDVVAGEPATLTVRGYDKSHRMARDQKTRVFTRMKDSAIASQIASSYGLTPDVVNTVVTFDYVMQNNQSDLELLEERAARINYEVVVDGKTLHFRPQEDSTRTQITLSLTEDVIELHPRLTAGGQVGRVEVRGWDPETKAAIVGSASTGQETRMGATTGPKMADDAFGVATVIKVDQPVFSKAEADQIALGMLKSMARSFITGEGTCFGDTRLESGKMVKIEGLGKRFSGVYDLVSVTHTYAPTRGYRSAISVKRNAIS